MRIFFFPGFDLDNFTEANPHMRPIGQGRDFVDVVEVGSAADVEAAGEEVSIGDRLVEMGKRLEALESWKNNCANFAAPVPPNVTVPHLLPGSMTTLHVGPGLAPMQTTAPVAAGPLHPMAQTPSEREASHARGLYGPPVDAGPASEFGQDWKNRAWAAYCADAKAHTIDKGKNACPGSRWGWDTWEQMPQELRDEYACKVASDRITVPPDVFDALAKATPPADDSDPCAHGDPTVDAVRNAMRGKMTLTERAIGAIAAIRRGEVPGLCDPRHVSGLYDAACKTLGESIGERDQLKARIAELEQARHVLAGNVERLQGTGQKLAAAEAERDQLKSRVAGLEAKLAEKEAVK